MMPGAKGLNPHELVHRWMKDPSLGFSTMIFGGNQKFISSQTSIFAGFFYVQKNLTKKFYLFTYIVL